MRAQAEPGGAAIIDGKEAAERLTQRVIEARRRLEAETGAVPGLAVVLVGDNPASRVYIRNKSRTAETCGFHSEQHTLSAETTEEELLALIEWLNGNPRIHGILVQLPLPRQIDPDKVIAALDPAKDVDGFHPVNAGLLAIGARDKALVPCTPAGSLRLIKSALGPDLSGLEAVVVGRSNIVGKPLAQLLLQESCTVTVAHSRTRELAEVCRRADILAAAVGRPRMVKGDWVKPGACVIDVGINRVPAPDMGEGRMRLVGDVDFAAASRVAGAITPVPGGVGPMTIAMLMANTLSAAARAADRSDIAGMLGQA